MRVTIALLAAAVGGASLWLLATSTGGAESGPAQAPVDETQRTQAPALQLPVGQQRAYTLSAHHDITLTAREGAQDVAFALEGTWRLSVVRTEPMLVRAELAGRVLADGKPHAGLTSELARPQYLDLAADGALAGVHFHEEHGDLARGLVQWLASAIQLVGVDGRASWESTERDATGRYVASYRRDGARITKTKQRYLDAPPGARIAELADSTTVQLDGRWPARVEANQVVAIASNALSVRTKSALSLVTIDADPVAVTADLTGYRLVRLGEARRHRPSAAEDRELLAGATLEDLVSALARLGADDAPRITAQLAALIRLDATTADQLAALVPAIDPRARGLALSALGEAATPAAQAALGELFATRTLDADTRISTATAMYALEVPAAQVTEALQRGIADADPDVSGAAAVALGAMASKLRDDPRGPALVDDLIARLGAATDPEHAVMLLRAIGNTGDARALPAVRVALASLHSRVRQAAVEAMRAMTDPTVDGLIAGVLATDAAAEVRRGAVFAARQRPFPAMLVAFDRALADADESVRTAVIDVLGGNATLPDARRLLERTAVRDPSPQVRSEARRYL